MPLFVVMTASPSRGNHVVGASVSRESAERMAREFRGCVSSAPDDTLIILECESDAIGVREVWADPAR